jgi:hypothetical protein
MRERRQVAGPASITHFFTLLFFPAPVTFFSCASASHFLTKELRARAGELLVLGRGHARRRMGTPPYFDALSASWAWP